MKEIAWERIPETATKTPDYELTILDQRIIAEVKEVDRNQEEIESDRLLAARGYGNVLSDTPGDRVRKKIDRSSAQIKARAMGKYPSIMILFDRGRLFGHIDPYNIRVAMYGLEQIHIALPPLGSASPYATGMSYGPKRKMTQEYNTSISAIGALWTPGPNQMELLVCHNKFAAIPLDPQLFGSHGIEQLELDEETAGTTAKWKSVVAAIPEQSRR